MLHLFSPHYSMGLNITNEMNICTFFHGVSAFREFHSFIVLKMFACIEWCVCVYLSLFNTHKNYIREHWLVCAWGSRIRARLLLLNRIYNTYIYMYCISLTIRCQCMRSANNIFFQSHTFFSVDLLHMS